MDTHRLPIFPLPIVLFPGTLIPLHIFEPEYREMVADVLKGDRRFGLVHHDPDRQGPFLCEEGRVGTIAGIRRQQPFPHGRSLIFVRGVQRFRVLSKAEGAAPYHEAVVTELHDDPCADPEALVARRERSLSLFQSVLHTMPHVPDALPRFDAREEISFKLAATVRTDPFWQQELLELRDEALRLSRLDPVLRAGMDRWLDGWKANARD
jgi:Lon protease-like protein